MDIPSHTPAAVHNIEYQRHKKLFFFFAFQRIEYLISVEHDEKPPQLKFSGNRFMGPRDVAA